MLLSTTREYDGTTWCGGIRMPLYCMGTLSGQGWTPTVEEGMYLLSIAAAMFCVCRCDGNSRHNVIGIFVFG